MRSDGPDAGGAPPADVAAVAALEPPPTSVRDVRTRLRWSTARATSALRTWREQRSPGVPQPPAPAAAAPPVTGAVRAALETALDAGGHGREHAAAVELARLYADRIDTDPDALGRHGRALLATLVELRLTPRTRVALVPPTPPGDPHAAEDDHDERGDELQKFRDRRDRRAYRASAVDPATP